MTQGITSADYHRERAQYHYQRARYHRLRAQWHREGLLPEKRKASWHDHEANLREVEAERHADEARRFDDLILPNQSSAPIHKASDSERFDPSKLNSATILQLQEMSSLLAAHATGT